MKTAGRIGGLSRRGMAAARHRAEAPISLVRWYRQGCPTPPPPAYKQAVLRRHLHAHRLGTFVETGTYLGETACALARHAATVVTIELSPELAASARRRLAGGNNVSVLEGDSAVLLPAVLEDLREPALFWLDGHYSAGITARGPVDTPVRQELEAVLRHHLDGHVILIDDARHFTGGDYPALAEIHSAVRELAPRYRMNVRHDIIRILPADSPLTSDR